MKDKGRAITKVRITGAGGRMGRTLTEGLADKYELTLFIRNTQPDTSRNLKIVKADLAKEEEVKGIFERLDAVIHMAPNPQSRRDGTCPVHGPGEYSLRYRYGRSGLQPEESRIQLYPGPSPHTDKLCQSLCP